MTDSPMMRAVFFESQRTMTLREVPVPEPEPGEVRLSVRYCGICGSDLSMYKGGALAGPDVVLGHEISAVVDFDPQGQWQAGARVAVFPATGCGECVWCREGQPRYCVGLRPDRFGGFGEYVCYPAENLIPIPDELDDKAAATADPLGVALRAVDIASPEPGDLAYVSGLGSIGQFTVSSLAAAGCRIIGADPREDRRALGLELGCERVIDPTAQDPYDATLGFDPHGARFAFECSGVPDSLHQIFDACGHGGVVGVLGIPMAPVLLLRMTVREQRAFSISGPTFESMGRALEHLQERPEARRVITETVSLGEVGPTMERLIEGQGGPKILVSSQD